MKNSNKTRLLGAIPDLNAKKSWIFGVPEI